ncbi:MAG: TetR/AcrR family transcriptional regulator [Pseudomonadaceae bacterium]|nr:TetR/AcrR family transcriptional regulator [Pseudomonadaceae bacterium]
MNAQKPKPRKEQQRATETKTAVLNAALAEFGAKGFDGATTRGIAAIADVNHTIITHHFGSKEDLWKATASHVFGLYADRINRRRNDLDGVDAKTLHRLLLREFILFTADVPEFNQFMTQASQAGGERLEWLVATHIGPGSENEIGVIEEAQSNELLGPGDPQYMRLLFIGAATSIFTWANVYKLLAGENSFSSDVVDRHVDMVLDLFDRG